MNPQSAATAPRTRSFRRANKPAPLRTGQRRIELLRHTSQNTLGFEPGYSGPPSPVGSPVNALATPSASFHPSFESKSAPAELPHRLQRLTLTDSPTPADYRQLIPKSPHRMHSKFPFDLGNAPSPGAKYPILQGQIDDKTFCDARGNNEFKVSNTQTRHRRYKLDDRTPLDVAEDAGSLRCSVSKAAAETDIPPASPYNLTSLPSPDMLAEESTENSSLYYGALGIAVPGVRILQNDAPPNSNSLNRDKVSTIPEIVRTLREDQSVDWLDDPSPRFEETFARKQDPVFRWQEINCSRHSGGESLEGTSMPTIKPIAQAKPSLREAPQHQSRIPAMRRCSSETNSSPRLIPGRTPPSASIPLSSTLSCALEPTEDPRQAEMLTVPQNLESPNANSLLSGNRSYPSKFSHFRSKNKTASVDSGFTQACVPFQSASYVANSTPASFLERIEVEAPKTPRRRRLKSYIQCALQKLGTTCMTPVDRQSQNDLACIELAQDPIAIGYDQEIHKFPNARAGYPIAVIDRDANGFFQSNSRQVAPPQETSEWRRLIDSRHTQ